MEVEEALTVLEESTEEELEIVLSEPLLQLMLDLKAAIEKGERE